MHSEIMDITGKTVGHWKVMSDAGRASNNEVMWLCMCSCGNIRKVRGAKLRNGKSQSCGCITEKNDITGKKFGRWKVLGRTRDHNGESKWMCTDGKNHVIVSTTMLKSRTFKPGTEGKGEWEIVAQSGERLRLYDKEWVVANNAPKPNMIVAQCSVTGVMALFPESMSLGSMPPNYFFETVEKELDDLTGDTYESWKVLERDSKNKYGQYMWKCECQNCGAINSIVGFALKRGTGCRNCTKIYGRASHTGERHGVWEVLERAAKKNYYSCRCEGCGFEKDYSYSHMKNKTPKCPNCGKWHKTTSEKEAPQKG